MDEYIIFRILYYAVLTTISTAQCPIGTTITFEKVTNVNIRGVTLIPLYTGQPEIPISAECNNRCRAGINCRAFLLDYSKHLCLGLGYDTNSRGSSLVPVSSKTSFFEKLCISAPTCEKAWTFERIIGRQLLGLDNRIFSDISSRLRCQEICLQERAFICRSGEYDYLTQECRLSSEDRHTQPSYFAAASPSIDYFENQCAPIPLVNEDNTNGKGDCGYKRIENFNIERADLLRSAYNEDQCRSICEATRAFVCRSFVYKPSASLCWLSSDDSSNIGGIENLTPSEGVIYFERSICLNLKLDCTQDSMRVSLNTIGPFEGKIYAKDDPISCETLGRSQTTTSLILPILKYPKCGIKQELDGKYSSTVIVQYHPIIQRKGDKMIRLVCNFEGSTRMITNTYRVIPGPDISGSSSVVNATASSPNIRLRITDREGVDIKGARLGEELYLRIEMENDSLFDIFARDLIARSGSTDEALTLIDSNGCPTDTSIFPSLERLPGTKSLQGKFDAFKFADDVIVRFQVNVHFCLQKCSPNSCSDYLSMSTTEPNTTANSRNKRSPSSLSSASLPSIPDYPLQREIIVQGLSSINKPTNNASIDMDKSTYCTTKSKLISTFMIIFVIQITVVIICFIILFGLRKSNCFKYGSNKMELYPSFNQME